MALPILYGLGMGLARLGPAAVRGYRTFKKARQVAGLGKSKAAQGKSFGLGYEGTLAQKALGSRGAGLGSGKGLQGLMSKGAKKFPGATGSTELAGGLYYGGEGVGDIMEGAGEGDVGQIASGIGQLAFGAPVVGRGLRTLGAQRTLKSKFPETAAAMRTTGKEFNKKIPMGKASLVGFGGIGAGAVLGETPPPGGSGGSPGADDQVLGNPVEVVIKKIEYDKANSEEFKKRTGVEVTSPEYKKLAQKALNQAYKQAEEQGIKPTKTADELASVFNFSGTNVTDETKIPVTETGALTNSPMTGAEISNIAKKQEAGVKAGKKMKDKMLSTADSKEADQFNRFYDRIQNLTGGNTNTNDLIMLKLASGLISGKSAQKGVRGFLDVLGQAGSETTDTAMALFQKEADRRNNLAVAFLKAKEKPKNNMAVTGTRQRIVTNDPNSLFGLNSFDKDTFKADGRDAIAVPEFDENGNNIGTQWVPMKYTNYTPIKVSPSREAKDRTRLNSISLGWKMTQEVQKIDNSALGFRGVFGESVENFFGLLGGIAEEAGFEGIDEVGGKIDQDILKDIINAKVYDEENNVIAATEDQLKEAAKLKEMYRKETSELFEDIRSNDKRLSSIARAKLIQTRMKYILANANKADDRLTVADVNNAAENTQILKVFSSPAQIKRQYAQLAKELEANFQLAGASYIQGGGTPTWITSQYQFMPSVKKYINEQQTKLTEQNVLKNLESQIGSIE
jgi:hypothetical protein